MLMMGRLCMAASGAGGGVNGKSLYLLFDFAVNLKLL